MVALNKNQNIHCSIKAGIAIDFDLAKKFQDYLFHIKMTSVAVVGTGGFLFKPVAAGLLDPLFKSNYKLPIKALTRDPSKEEKIEGLEYVKIDYADKTTIEKALEGVDTVINLMGSTAPFESYKILIDAAVKAGVQKFITSDFGCDYRYIGQKNLLDSKAEIAAYGRQAGIPKVIQIMNGLFMQFLTFGFFGHNLKEAKAEFLGDGTQTVVVTDLSDIGKAVGSIAYRPASEIPDYINIKGQRVTLNETAEIYEKATGKKMAVTYKEPEPVESIPGLTDFVLFLQTLSAHPETKAFDSVDNDNELVNPGLWKWKQMDELFQTFA
ncbi:NmrA-like family-domain-containing protein [Lipomyces oligophaga]|uniref:NmrA-like family-domain-containing protein n=1 Tax=Lipomyces oligophaga TaxID=45792 RepID=UPI0034D0227D